MSKKMESLEKLAIAKIAEFPELAGYTFGYCKRIDPKRLRRYGQFSTKIKRIEISPTFIDLSPDEAIWDTVLHEIAHALADARTYRPCGHNSVWKKICVEIGAKPTRYSGFSLSKYLKDQKK